MTTPKPSPVPPLPPKPPPPPPPPPQNCKPMVGGMPMVPQDPEPPAQPPGPPPPPPSPAKAQRPMPQAPPLLMVVSSGFANGGGVAPVSVVYAPTSRNGEAPSEAKLFGSSGPACARPGHRARTRAVSVTNMFQRVCRVMTKPSC